MCLAIQSGVGIAWRDRKDAAVWATRICCFKCCYLLKTTFEHPHFTHAGSDRMLFKCDLSHQWQLSPHSYHTKYNCTPYRRRLLIQSLSWKKFVIHSCIFFINNKHDTFLNFQITTPLELSKCEVVQCSIKTTKKIPSYVTIAGGVLLSRQHWEWWQSAACHV